MACDATAFHLHATLLFLYISDLGASCSPKSSLLSYPVNAVILHHTCTILLHSLHSDLFFLPCTLLCAAPLPTARKPSSCCVLSPSKFAKGPRVKPLSPETIELMFPHHNNPLRN